MSQDKRTRSADCRRLENQLYHYQAGELETAEAEWVAAHLADCPDCARRDRIESGLLETIRTRYERTPAPPGLRDRIVANLPEAGSAGGAPWWRMPWLVPAAAALMLVLVLIPGLPRLAGVLDVAREVIVVDIDCELYGKSLAQQRRCTHPHHLNALRVDDDTYWNVDLGDETGRRIASDREMRGARLRIEGDLLSRTRTVRVDEFEMIEMTGLDSARLH